jgi:dihydroneopterin aldolase/2-amino-4-hydroxy-6-hydroxymethyldihydropteridine diphosphokinase
LHRFEDETIHITNLRVECIVGVRPQERERAQPLVISASFPADFSAAGDSDALDDTVDYSAVAREIETFVTEGRFGLLETLIRRLAAHLGERFGLSRVSLHVRKPEAVENCDGPAVSLTWVREEGERP